jgi:hypothetical protein
MSQLDVHRFAIADTKPRSECWAIFTNKNDVYLTGSAYKQALKLSLHGSGVCQIALLDNFFEKHISWRESSPDHRAILRWKRLPTPLFGGQCAASILFASFDFWPEHEAINASKKYIALKPPAKNFARRVDVVFSRADPRHIAKLGDWTDELIFCKKLPNGEYVCLLQFLEPLSQSFFDFTPIESPYFVTLGLEEGEIDDARGISALDCAIFHEGHGCIRSLHNMRIARVSIDDDDRK